MRLSAPGFLLACAFATVAALGVRAQDGQHGQGHAENHDWYKELKQPQTGYSCCNGRTGTASTATAARPAPTSTTTACGAR